MVILQTTSKFPKTQADAKQHNIRPRILLGINSVKNDHTIGILPPTLIK